MTGQPMFPLLLNLKGRAAVVIGGGAVGRRKAAALLRAEAVVRLICLEPRPSQENAPGLEWLQEPYRAGHLDGAVLVFAAASGEVNRQVARDAHDRRIWVNVADDPAACDFMVPATLRRGPLMLAVSTAGTAPALAREMRQLLEAQFDESFGEWVTLLAEVRPLVRAGVTDAARRHALLRRLCSPDWLAHFRRDGRDAVRSAILAEVRALAARPGAEL